MKRKLICLLSSFVLVFAFVLSFGALSFTRAEISSMQEPSYAPGEVELGLYRSTGSSEMQYISPQEGNIYILDFDLSVEYELRVQSQLLDDDEVKFYYFTDGNYKYIEIPDTDNDRVVDITTLLSSSGTYKFFAKINNNLIGENNIYTIKILTKAMLNVNITYEEIIGEAGSMNHYRLILNNIGGNSSGYDLNNLTILWYINGSLSPARQGNYAEYIPEEEGRFSVTVDVLDGQGMTLFSQENIPPEIEILARSNNTANVLMYVLIVVGVLTVGLVISIVIKVKSEKVW